MIEIIQSNRNDREGKHRTGMTKTQNDRWNLIMSAVISA